MKDDRWPIWKLAMVLYPFAAGAMAVNLFMASLIGPAIGFEPLSPNVSIIGGLILGVPAAWAAGRWARHMMDEADS